jgi:hypothetical protein
MGAALAPLTAAASRASPPDDAGAASGVVNAAQQLGVSLGVSVLVTVAARAAARRPAGAAACARRRRARPARARRRPALTGSAVLLALGLAVVAAPSGQTPAAAGQSPTPRILSEDRPMNANTSTRIVAAGVTSRLPARPRVRSARGGERRPRARQSPPRPRWSAVAQGTH